MSAIAGIVHFDGTPVARQDLERMSQALEPFGRDGQRIVVGNGLGFVVRTTLLTPEDRLDHQPVTLAEHDTLLFDGRLDNRPELIRLLGLSESEGRMLADSTLAARAWERWGRDSLIRMIGQFGLAHWSSAARRLILARSAPRGRQLYFCRQGARLYFASAPHGLFALPQVPRELNESAIGDLLLLNDSEGETLYRNIELVQSSRWAEFRIDASESRRYWYADPNHHFSFKREEEVWEAFQTLFEEVVVSHLRSIHPIGVQMSGGLDSAAVAGQAAHILAKRGQTLRGYTRIPAPGALLRPDGLTYSNERSKVELIAHMHPNLRTNFVHAGDEPVLDGLGSYFLSSYSSGPLSPTFLTGYSVLYRRAADDGVRVLLTGAAGNGTFSYDGIPRLRALFRQGRWFNLYRELRGLDHFLGHSHGLFKHQIFELTGLNDLRNLLARLRNRHKEHFSSAGLAIKESFVKSSGALERKRNQKHGLEYWGRLSGWEWRAQAFDGNGWFGADAKLAQYGLDSRDPTVDRRIVEFCLALPDEIFLKDGIDRRLARLGLAHLIPVSVRMDPARGLQDVDWHFRMHKQSTAIAQAIDQLTNDATVGSYLDLPAIRAQWQEFETIDVRHAPFAEWVRYQRGLMGAIELGLFIRWFEHGN